MPNISWRRVGEITVFWRCFPALSGRVRGVICPHLAHRLNRAFGGVGYHAGRPTVCDNNRLEWGVRA